MTAVQLALFGDPGAALSVIGICPACMQPVTGMASAAYPHLVALDIHLHPKVPAWCVAGRACGDYLVRRTYPKAGEAA